MKADMMEIKPIEPKVVKFTIIGDSDLVLNKMNDVTVRALTDQRKDKAASKEKPNEWEEIITAIHWRDGKPSEFTEQAYYDALANNAPCISGFGFMKSLGEAVVRTKVETYSTGFDAAVNYIAPGGLFPIKFVDAFLDEKLMSPKKGAPVLSRTTRFTGWSCEITLSFLDTSYSIEQLIDIVNRAGFGIGIGSGRRGNRNGRYHVDPETIEYVG